MLETLIDFLFNMVNELSNFGTWLVTPLDHINMPPLALFSFGGLTLVISFLVIRLVIGG